MEGRASCAYCGTPLGDGGLSFGRMPVCSRLLCLEAAFRPIDVPEGFVHRAQEVQGGPGPLRGPTPAREAGDSKTLQGSL